MNESFETYITNILIKICLTNKNISTLEIVEIMPTTYDPETFTPRKGIIIKINGKDLKMVLNAKLAADSPEILYEYMENEIMHFIEKGI